MAGLYLHVPFCRQACHYCDFHFSTQTKHMDDLVAAMVQETACGSPLNPRWKTKPSPPSTWGRNPSILPPTCSKIWSGCSRVGQPVTDFREVTLEANPEDMTETQIQAWLELVTRLSLGSSRSTTTPWLG